MAKAAQNVILSPSRDGPFNWRVPSLPDVWRITSGVVVERLAGDTTRPCLLHRLYALPMGNEAAFCVTPQGMCPGLKLTSAAAALLNVCR